MTLFRSGHAQLLLLVCALASVAGCARAEDPGTDGQSHWLSTCTADNDCGAELSCWCGRCTTTCGRPDACGDGVNVCLEARSFCGQEMTNVAGLCTETCDADVDCPSGLRCSDQRCVLNFEAGEGQLSVADAAVHPDASGTGGGTSTSGSCDGGFVLQLPVQVLADRLSNALFLTPADEIFAARVEQADLRTSGEVACFVEALLQEPDVRPGIEAFYRQWLQIDRSAAADPVAFPVFTEETLAALREEALRFASDVTLDEQGSLRTLLTAQHGFANAISAPIYGVSVEGSDLQRVDLTGSGRFGIFGLGFFLATRANELRSSPTQRGLGVLTGLLCVSIPMPPPSVDRVSIGGDATRDVTTRELYSVHDSSPTCSVCHSVFDPLGYAFEHFDAIGRFRADEYGLAIDTSGSAAVEGESFEFTNLEELMDELAASPTARSCFAKHWLEHFLQREFTEQEQSMAEQVAQDAEVNGELQLGRLISQSLASPLFLAP